jgi:hypothetical protein
MPRIQLLFVSALTLTFGLALGASPARALELSLDRGLLDEAAFVLQTQSGTKTGTKTNNTTSSNEPLIQPGSGFGIGLQIGTPTALTVKFPASGADIVLGLGVGYGGGFRNYGFAGLSIHGDYLFNVAQLVQTGDVGVNAYIGPGLWLTLFHGGYGYRVPGSYYYSRETFLGLGVRFPLGINARFANAPVEIYLELDPAIFVFPGIDGFIGASLGFRWFF